MGKYNLSKAVVCRFLRAAAAVILAGIAVKYGNSQWYLVIAPVLLAIDKAVRG